MSAPIRQRPKGATIVALLLGWLAIGGFGNAFMWQVVGGSMDVPRNSPAARFLELAQGPMLPVLTLLYGVTALAACIGIWRMRPWMDKAFLAWGISLAALGIWMTFAIPKELMLGGKPAGLAFVLVCALLVFGGYRYVHRVKLNNAL
jgi:hypothetical protein